MYSFDGWRSSALLIFTFVAGGLWAGAAVLWTARRTWGVVLGGAIVVVALAVGAREVAIGSRFATVSAAEFQAARLGMARAQLEQRLGAPLTTNATETRSSPAPALGCDVYRPASGSHYSEAFFCFRDGVLALKFHQPEGFAP